MTAIIDSRGVVIIDTPHVLQFDEGVVQVGVIRRFLTEAVVTPTQPQKRKQLRLEPGSDNSYAQWRLIDSPTRST